MYRTSRTQPEALLSQEQGLRLSGCWAGGTVKTRRVDGRHQAEPRGDGRCFIWNLRKALCSVANKLAMCHGVCRAMLPC